MVEYSPQIFASKEKATTIVCNPPLRCYELLDNIGGRISGASRLHVQIG